MKDDDFENAQKEGQSTLKGLGVLALLPSKRAGYRYALAPLEFSKSQLDWHINVVCEERERKNYLELAGPSGKIFPSPDLECLPAADWEKDPEAAAELDRRLWEAQLAARIPVGQLVLAGELSVGHAFVRPVLRLRETGTAKHVLTDNAEPVNIFRRLFSIADEVLKTSAADIVYTLDSIDPFSSAVWLAAQRRGVPCITVRKSKIRSDHFYFTNDRLLYNTLALERAKERRAAESPISDSARAQIKQFRAQPNMIKYQERKKVKRQSFNWFARHYRLLRKVMAAPRKKLGLGILNSLDRFNRPLLTVPFHRRFLRSFDEAQLAAMKYIYFPMHKEADIPLIYQASTWYDQRHTVGLLASNLPAGLKLLVREHRSNFGYRPMSYYQELSRLPNVVMIDAYDSQFKYLRNADLIVTENGSSGWEGLLYSRRVVTLDRTFYDGAGLATKVEHPSQLGAMILEALSKPTVADPSTHDINLGYMIDAEFDTTFAMDFESPADLDRIWDAFSVLIRRGRKS